MRTETAGITRANDGLDGIKWNILGQIYVPKHVTEHSFSWHATFPAETFVPPHIHPTQDEYILMLEGTWKLLRALHYKGDFATPSREGKQQVFARGKQVAEAGIDRLARRVGGRQKLDAMTPAQAAKAVADVPEAKPLFLWAAVHWGLWGDVFGRLAAARQGVGDRVRRYSEILIALDERYEDAAGHRVLGRLHTLAPKVPFFTGWVDRDKAVAELRRAVALGPGNLDNHLFLAEALLEHQPARAAEAREILRRLLARKPVPALVVEQERTLANARALLAKHPA